jgi:putative SOS response-associated peptidase YedK
MCGRFTLHHTEDEIIARFAVAEVAAQTELFEPRYNVAPSQYVAAVIERDHRQLVGLKWGLIPSWAKDPAIGNRMINARAETLAEKPSYRQALAKRRCLIPADGFYEWKKAQGGSQPYHVRRRDGALFAFAGLWEEWKDEAGRALETCTIITVEPNDLMAKIHDRMPAILKPEHEELWLDAKASYSPALTQLLRSYPDGELEAYPVSRAVNSPAHNDPSYVEPAG